MPHDQAYFEAENKIEEALKSGATELILSPGYGAAGKEKLTELPDSLWQLTQLTKLDLSKNQLTALPNSLGQLTQLTELDLSNNQLTVLPDSLGQLTPLQKLSFSVNPLNRLPVWIGNLVQLQELEMRQLWLHGLPEELDSLRHLKKLVLTNNHLRKLPQVLRKLKALEQLYIPHNGLESIPPWISELNNLRYIYADGNKLTDLPALFSELSNLRVLFLGDAVGNPLKKIPDCIRKLNKLEVLGISKCSLNSLPLWLREIEALQYLYLSENLLSDIPASLAQLEHLEKLYLDGNPLNPALQSAYDQGLDAVKAYIRSLEGNAEPLYEAKLVLVGEGNVGKTTLLKALKGKEDAAPREHEPTTHGVEIDIHGLRLPHPAKDGVEIQLNAWDFGGQDVYRVTHQFFFSRRSLYLLVWEPRRGVQAGQVEDWLNMIRLRVGDEARVIIVSTHCKTGERIARIDRPVFQQQYGDMIVGFYEVDSLVSDEHTGEMVGIAQLKEVIAAEAAKLNHVGMLFNNDWKAARDELVARPEPHISYSTFAETCARHGLSEIDTTTLAGIMNDLGYIVHYSDDEKLRDDAILKPEWLTKAIGFVLEDRATQESEGILPDTRLYNVWHDHPFKDEQQYDSSLYPFFLRLMEKYDVSYRLPEGKGSLVAQHVPQVRPELPWLPEQETPENMRRIAMVCSMEEDPPGLVPWMIVRTHDYAVEKGNHQLHWQKGMFLSSSAARRSHAGKARARIPCLHSS